MTRPVTVLSIPLDVVWEMRIPPLRGLALSASWTMERICSATSSRSLDDSSKAESSFHLATVWWQKFITSSARILTASHFPPRAYAAICVFFSVACLRSSRADLAFSPELASLAAARAPSATKRTQMLTTSPQIAAMSPGRFDAVAHVHCRIGVGIVSARMSSPVGIKIETAIANQGNLAMRVRIALSLTSSYYSRPDAEL